MRRQFQRSDAIQDYKPPRPEKCKNILRKLNIFFIYESVEVFATVPRMGNVSGPSKLLQFFIEPRMSGGRNAECYLLRDLPDTEEQRESPSQCLINAAGGDWVGITGNITCTDASPHLHPNHSP